MQAIQARGRAAGRRRGLQDVPLLAAQLLGGRSRWYGNVSHSLTAAPGYSRSPNKLERYF